MSLVSGTNYTTEITTRKNAIINGNFDIWQRGTNFVALSSAEYSADRFQYIASGAVVHTVARSADVPTYAQSGISSNYSLLCDVTTADATIAAGDYSFITHKVEGYDYAQLAGGNATLSFWVKAAKTGIHCVSFRNDGVDRAYIAEYTVATADTWQKVIITVPLTETGGTWDYINGTGLDISFILACGSTFHTTKDTWQTGNLLATSSQVNEVDNVANNFRIAQVQLERGEVATDIESRPYAGELALCQRYYWQGDGTLGSGYLNSTGSLSTMLAMPVLFPVTMRAQPTFAVVTSPTFSNCSAVTLNGSADGFNVRVQTTATGRYRAVNGVYSADAEL